MTLQVVITVPLAPNSMAQREARVDMIGTMGPAGQGPHAEYLRPGEERTYHVHSGMNLRVSEVAAGTADAVDEQRKRRA